jgi:hypothetical protein
MEIHVDWTDLEQAYDGYVRVMFFTDAASGLVTTYGTKKENLAALKDYVEYIENHHKVKVKMVHSDNELFTKRTRAWLRKKVIDAEPSAPRTQDQNGDYHLHTPAEQSQSAVRRNPISAACFLVLVDPKNVS